MSANAKAFSLDRTSGSRPGKALITGASSGIGEATARAFAQAGFDLLLVARSRVKLSALASELTAVGVQAEVVTIDLADCEQVKGRIEEAIARFGPIDILVNSAGMGYTGPIGDMPLADWQQVIALNVTSVFQVIQAVLPGMRTRSSGLIINIASIAAQQTFPNWGAYSVSKAALAQLSNAISAEESTSGIRVVTLSPGAVNTPIWDTDTVDADFERSAMLTPQTVAQTILHIARMPASTLISHLTITPSAGAL